MLLNCRNPKATIEIAELNNPRLSHLQEVSFGDTLTKHYKIYEKSVIPILQALPSEEVHPPWNCRDASSDVGSGQTLPCPQKLNFSSQQ